MTNMGSSNLFRIVPIIGIGLILALSILNNVLSGGGNVVANYYRYMVGGVVIFGLIAPKQSVYLLVIMGVFLGAMKKFLILDGRFGFIELYFIMGMPAYMLLGTCVSTFFREVVSGRINKNDLMLVVVVSLMSATAIGGFFIMGKGFAIAVSTGAYINVIWVLALNFKKEKEIQSLIVVTLVALIPAAFYGISQSLFGLSALDLLYLESGFSQSEGESSLRGVEPRPFSTFGSNAHYGLCMVLMGVFIMQLRTRKRNRGLGKSLLLLLLLALSVWGAFSSTNKSAVIAIPFMLIACQMVRSRVFLLSALFGGIAFIYFIAFNGDFVSQKLYDWSKVTSKVHQGFTLNTFNVRIKSFEELKNPDTYHWFGRDLKEVRMQGQSSHTMITDVLIGIGTLPTVVILVLGLGLVLYLQSRYIVPLRKWSRRWDVYIAVAFFVTIIVAGIVGANAYTSFPTSLFIWLQLGVAIWYIKYSGHIDQLESSPDPLTVDGAEQADLKQEVQYV